MWVVGQWLRAYRLSTVRLRAKGVAFFLRVFFAVGLVRTAFFLVARFAATCFLAVRGVVFVLGVFLTIRFFVVRGATFFLAVFLMTRFFVTRGMAFFFVAFLTTRFFEVFWAVVFLWVDFFFAVTFFFLVTGLAVTVFGDTSWTFCRLLTSRTEAGGVPVGEGRCRTAMPVPWPPQLPPLHQRRVWVSLLS